MSETQVDLKPNGPPNYANGHAGPQVAVEQKRGCDDARHDHARNRSKYHDGVNLFLALAMTVATCALTWLAWNASDTTEKQLRAYVHPTVTASNGVIVATVRNTGQTPGRVRVKIEPVAPETGSIEATQFVKEGATVFLGAGCSETVEHEFRSPIRSVTVRLTCTDIFDKVQHSTFVFKRRAGKLVLSGQR